MAYSCLIALLVVGHAVGKEMSCTPPVKGATRKVAFTRQTEEKMCKHFVPAISDKDMSSTCEKFCAIRKRHLALPLLMGSETYGFSYPEMQSMCRVVAEDNDATMTDCQAKSGALQEIEVKASDFVAAVSVFKAEQMAFQAQMFKNAEDLRTELQSIAFAKEMDKVTDKLGKLKLKFEEFTKKGDETKSSGSALPTAMQKLKERGENLKATVDKNLKVFEEYIGTCNKMIISRGEKGEYLLDICSQKNAMCIDDIAVGGVDPGHVGCCCAINPVAIHGNLKIDGISDESAFLGARVNAGTGRRLDENTLVDVCALAKQKSAKEVSDATTRIRALNQQKLLDEAENEKKKKYPEYVSWCHGRRLGVNSNTHSHNPSRPAINSTRRLELKSCKPLTDQGTSLKVVLSPLVTQDMCKHHSPKISDSLMSKQCNDFCKPLGISMLMGTETYGFNLKGAKDICLPPNGVLKYDKAKLEKCTTWANAFNAVEKESAGFVKQLSIFKAAKVFFTAEILNAVKKVQVYVATEEFKKKMDKAINKSFTFQDAIKSQIDLENTDGKKRLNAETTALKASVNKLQTTLSSSLQMVSDFLAGCNDLYTAPGPNNEFLLDICAQGNAECFEGNAAAHVSCCCAYNPVALLGRSDPQIITGLGRRLGAKEVGGSVDMCAEAWTGAKPEVDKMYDACSKLGQEAVVKDFSQDVTTEYGDLYCGFAQKSTAATKPSKEEADHTVAFASMRTVIAIMLIKFL